jgi:general stress protein YciG
MKEDLLKKAMREMGSRGGKRRLETMTAEQRSEIARKGGESSAKVRAAKKAAAASAKVRTKKAAAKRRGT